MSKIKKKSYQEVLRRFKNLEKLKDIARDYNVSSARIGQIIINILLKKDINEIKKIKKINNLTNRINKRRKKYLLDKDFKEKTKSRALLRYYNLKKCNQHSPEQSKTEPSN